MNDKLAATLLARALFPLLKDTEGVCIHFEGKGYIVAKTLDGENNEPIVTVSRDDDMLQYLDLQLLWIHDEPVGNA
jgi:hypothetical protein